MVHKRAQPLADPADVRMAEGELPPESRGSTLWEDIRYAGHLIGRYFRADPVVGPLFLMLKLGLGAGVSYIIVNQQLTASSITSALAERRGDLLYGLVTTLVLMTLTSTLVQLTAEWFRYVFQIRARTQLTSLLMGRWLADDRYYRLERQAHVDHPEQRIQEDIRIFVDQALSVVPGTIMSLFPVFLYSSKLWKMSPPLSLAGIGLPYVVHGHLFVFTVAVAVSWTFVVHFVGRRLTTTEITRQSLEAEFRQQLAGLRENGEAIAFQRGGPLEAARLRGTFDLIRANWTHFTWANLRLSFTTGIPGQVFLIGPAVICAPFVLDGRMRVGDIQFIGAAMASIYMAVGTFIVSYAAIAILRSAVSRLRYFDERLDQVVVEGGIAVQPGTAPAFATHEMAIDYPDGRPMVEVADLQVGRGDRVLVRGRSGIGKSTFLRALAGLWPHGHGNVDVPARASIHFVPQRSYMPAGTLAALMSYPVDPATIADERYHELLDRLGLGRLKDRLHRHAQWGRELSPGEQQRVAAARAVLNAPDFLFVDEATSALDLHSEETFYTLLAEHLPEAAIISIAHRPTVERYHDRVIDFADGRATQTPLSAIASDQRTE